MNSPPSARTSAQSTSTTASGLGIANIDLISSASPSAPTPASQQASSIFNNYTMGYEQGSPYRPASQGEAGPSSYPSQSNPNSNPNSFSNHKPIYPGSSPIRLRKPKSSNTLSLPGVGGNESVGSKSSGRSKNSYQRIPEGHGDDDDADERERTRQARDRVYLNEAVSVPTVSTYRPLPPPVASVHLPTPVLSLDYAHSHNNNQPQSNQPAPGIRPELLRLRSDQQPMSKFSPPTPQHGSDIPTLSGNVAGLGRYGGGMGLLPWKSAGLALLGSGSGNGSGVGAGGGGASSSAPGTMSHQGNAGNGRRPMGAGIAVPTPANNNTPYIPGNEPFSAITSNSAVFPPRAEGPRKRALSEGECQLNRQGTLLTPHADSKRASTELGILLGNNNQRANKSRLLPQGELPLEEKLAKLDQVKLEAKKGRKARVEVDVILESDVLVEGGELRGRLEVRIRRGRVGEGLWIGGGKVRVCGYEEHSFTSMRHIFFHYPHQLPLFQPYDSAASTHPIFASPPNEEGYRMAREGVHVIPFSFRLPLKGGAKGAWLGSQNSTVRYVVVGSIKLHTPETGKRAIAHFYRPCIIYPYIDPSKVLGNASGGEVEVGAEQTLGWQLSCDKGPVSMTVKLPRPNWIAGQQVWLDITVNNQSARRIKTSTLTLYRIVTTFTPPLAAKLAVKEGSPDMSRYMPRFSRKKLVEQTVEASAGPGKGYVGSFGWWTGVHSGERTRWQSSLTLPADCLSIPRSKLVDVQYAIRVTLNGTIHAEVPVNIINFVSIDPPPMCAFSASVAKSYSVPINVAEKVPFQEPIPQRNIYAQVQQPLRNIAQALDYSHEKEDESFYNEKYLSPEQVQMPSPDPAPAPANRRPMSMQSEVGNSRPGWHPSLSTIPASEAEGLKSRPSTMSPLVRSRSTPGSRPTSSKRDTTISYLSAVASLDEDEDMRLAESRRRAGRQASLAALEHGIRQRAGLAAEPEEADEEEVLMTPPVGTYAPDRTIASVLGSPVLEAELSEAQQDLDFVKVATSPNPDKAGSPPLASGSLYDGDSQSRYLEEELEDEHAYSSRFAPDEIDGPVPEGPKHGRQAKSVSSPPMFYDKVHPPAVDIQSMRGSHYVAKDSDQDGSMSTRSLADSREPGPLDSLRQRHIGESRSVYGSFAASAVSVASGNESEIGQVVQAIRRNLTLKSSGVEEEDEGEQDRVATKVVEAMPNFRKYLNVPRSNSLSVMDDTPEQRQRRPSAPAIRSRRPSDWADMEAKRSLTPGPDFNPSLRTALAMHARPSTADGHGAWKRPILSVDTKLAEEAGEAGDIIVSLNSAPVTPDTRAHSITAQPMSAPADYKPYGRTEPPSSLRARPSPSPLAQEPMILEPTPGLAPSIASDSASSHENEESGAITPAERKAYFGKNALSGRTADSQDTVSNDNVRVWRASDSSSGTSTWKSHYAEKRAQVKTRVPSGPRERPMPSPKQVYRPQYLPTPVEEPEPGSRSWIEATGAGDSPGRRSHTTVLGSARSRPTFTKDIFGPSPERLSPLNVPRLSVDDISASPSPKQSISNSFQVAAIARDLERKGSQTSVKSSSTTATQLERWLLERKGSNYNFEHSKYLRGYAKRGGSILSLHGEDEDEEESESLL